MKIRNLITTAAAVAGTVAAVAAGLAASTVPASAGVTGYSPVGYVTLSSTGDGATATCDSGQTVLTTGLVTSTTYAQADVNGATGTLVPTSEPVFTTTNYAAGSPRWVITLSNGDSLWGYPPNAGLNGTDFGWAVNNGNTYTDWATALATAGVTSTTTVKDVFIIADGDQAPGTQDVITDAQYDGYALTCLAEPAAQAPYGLHDAVYASDKHVASLYWSSGEPAGATFVTQAWNKTTRQMMPVTNYPGDLKAGVTGLATGTSYCWHNYVAGTLSYKGSGWSVIACFKTLAA